MTKEELAVIKEELEDGTILRDYLESVESTEKPAEVRKQLNAEYGEEAVKAMFEATRGNIAIRRVKRQIERVLALPAMKGKKTKLKNSLKAMINKI